MDNSIKTQIKCRKCDGLGVTSELVFCKFCRSTGFLNDWIENILGKSKLTGKYYWEINMVVTEDQE